MVTSLTELIVSLRKLNPTFTDDVIRGHLINLGNSKDAVDDALRVVNGANASEVVQNANRDMSKGVVFEEEKSDKSKSGYGYDGGSSFLGNTAPLKKKHHRIRNFFLFIIFVIALMLCGMFYLGSLTVKDFKGIKIEWKELTNVEYLKREGSLFLDQSIFKLNLSYKIIKSKFIPTSSDPLLNEVASDSNNFEVNADIDLIIQMERINKIRSALNAYASVYGSYPLSLSDITKLNTSKVNVTLPILNDSDIFDAFSNQPFIYKTDPKTGYNLSYNFKIPQDAIESDIFYDLIDYRLVYNTKTKNSSFVAILKYINGLNTATRDVISLEAIRTQIIDTNNNNVPDLLE